MGIVTTELPFGFCVSLYYVWCPPISGYGRLMANMSPILHLSLNLHPLQCEFAALPIKSWSLFSHLLYPSWTCDLLWPIGCGGSEGVLVLRWGPQRLLLLLLAPLKVCCHWVNRPVITCWKLTDIWLSHCCNHCQQLGNHRICEWGHPRPASPLSPSGDYTGVIESNKVQLSLAQISKTAQRMTHS